MIAQTAGPAGVGQVAAGWRRRRRCGGRGCCRWVGEGLGIGVGDGSSAVLVTVMVVGSSLMVTDSGSMDSSVQPAGRVGFGRPAQVTPVGMPEKLSLTLVEPAGMSTGTSVSNRSSLQSRVRSNDTSSSMLPSICLTIVQFADHAGR